MEGPSLYLAAEQLSPLLGKTIMKVSGNTHKIDKDRLVGLKIRDIFSFGKQLFFQFDDFALRVHFLLYGSFEATIKKQRVTGDYPKKNRAPRLSLFLRAGSVDMYSCSVRFVDGSDLRSTCDFSIDTMANSFDEKKAFVAARRKPDEEIADVLLDQTIFAGVGNIIKNEVLIRAKILPDRKVSSLSSTKLKNIITIVRAYVFQFYEWRKKFELKKHYVVYRQSKCKICENKVSRRRTGKRQRVSFICMHCQN